MDKTNEIKPKFAIAIEKPTEPRREPVTKREAEALRSANTLKPLRVLTIGGIREQAVHERIHQMRNALAKTIEDRLATRHKQLAPRDTFRAKTMTRRKKRSR